jgi:hypothetical protein
MNTDDGTTYTVVFKIHDKEAFEPYRKKLCELMMTQKPAEPIIPGVEARFLGWCALNKENRAYEDYIQYVESAIENETYADQILTFEEWVEDGQV